MIVFEGNTSTRLTALTADKSSIQRRCSLLFLGEEIKKEL